MAKVSRVSTTTLVLNDDEVVTVCIALGMLAQQNTLNPFDGRAVPTSTRQAGSRLWSLLAED